MSSSFGRKNTTPSQGKLTRQDRVNKAMFDAIERLGNRLHKTEAERDHLSQRLKNIESSAKRDKKTGQYYLPVQVRKDALPQVLTTPPPAPKWMVASTALSGFLAVVSVIVVLGKEPSLTPQQLQALNTFADPQFVMLAEQRWKPVTDMGAMAEPSQIVQADTDVAVATKTNEDDLDVEALFDQQPAEVTDQDLELVQAEEDPITSEAEQVADIVKDVTQAENNIVAENNNNVETVPAEDVVVEVENAEVSPEVSDEQETAKLSGGINVIEKADLEKEEAQSAQNELASSEESLRGSVSATTSPAPSRSQIRAEAHRTQTQKPQIQPDMSLPAEVTELESRALDNVAEAQHDLATLYAAGDVIDQDFARAVYWFERAAAQGVANAHYNLGVMYHQGLGVKTDLKQALNWYQNASELGHPEALYNLGIAYIEGIGTNVDVDRGVSFFKRAAHAGVAQAAYNLGILYESSFVGGVDKDGALEWYAQAAGLGHQDAIYAVERLGGQTNAETSVVQVDAEDMNEFEPASGGQQTIVVGEGDATEIPADNLQSQLVADIQAVLIEQDLLPGEPSGVMTPQTEDAIRSFQKQAGMPIDGRASQALLDFMHYAGRAE